MSLSQTLLLTSSETPIVGLLCRREHAISDPGWRSGASEIAPLIRIHIADKITEIELRGGSQWGAGLLGADCWKPGSLKPRSCSATNTNRAAVAPFSAALGSRHAMHIMDCRPGSLA